MFGLVLGYSCKSVATCMFCVRQETNKEALDLRFAVRCRSCLGYLWIHHLMRELVAGRQEKGVGEMMSEQ